MRQHTLMMGQLYASDVPCMITTVLGSCIAVCLWDEKQQRGGMNHFMLPRWDGKGVPSPRFGDIAIPGLIEAVVAVGGRRSNLVAKVFGGSNVLASQDNPDWYSVGQRNSEYALQALALEQIPIVAQKFNPNHGIKISFDTATGEVILRVLKKTA